MNPPRFHEAVKAAQDLLAKMPAVRSAVLFGSTARGSATEDSDIDLFIECKAEREEEVARALYGIEGVFNVRFGPTFFRQKDWRRFDFQFLESIFRQGQILKGRLPRLTPRDLDLQPLRLVSYYTGELSPRGGRNIFLRFTAIELSNA